jgi:hypothetical protein
MQAHQMQQTRANAGVELFGNTVNCRF